MATADEEFLKASIDAKRFIDDTRADSLPLAAERDDNHAALKHAMTGFFGREIPEDNELFKILAAVQAMAKFYGVKAESVLSTEHRVSVAHTKKQWAERFLRTTGIDQEYESIILYALDKREPKLDVALFITKQKR